jgi:hypothetical protein
VTRVEEGCLTIGGATWFSPRDPGRIEGLVLDLGAPPQVSSASVHLALVGPGRRELLAAGRMPVAGFPTLDSVPLIRTGISMGPVSVTVSEHPSTPTLDLSGWEDAAELSALVRELPVYVGGFSQDPGLIPHIGSANPGWYRLRVHARGRSVARDQVVSEPTEEYLIQVWRAGPAEPLALTESVTRP